MSMRDEYIAYLRDNPEHLWFKRKLYGWGWTPVSWQGWLSVFLYVIFLFAAALSLSKNVQPDQRAITLFLLKILGATFVLILLCYKKGERPRWQWGIPKDPTKDLPDTSSDI